MWFYFLHLKLMKFSITIIGYFFVSASMFSQLPDGFAIIQDEIPSIKVELRYFSSNNFVGDTIDGYHHNKVVLSKIATAALKNVQNELKKKSLGLKIFDAYRPQRAVNHFWKWALDENDTIMKQQYYPNVNKSKLFEEGYIAAKSGHSRGSTVDLTIINLKTGLDLEMGSSYDFFGEESWVNFHEISQNQKTNRKLLQDIMKQFGFKNYLQEWWHFTIKEEPFPETYFDFIVD